MLYLCRRETISNDISSERSTAKNYPILCNFLHFIFGGLRYFANTHTHTHTHTFAPSVTKTFFLFAYARAKRAVSPINKGLLGVSFVRFFMPFCKLDLEQNKKEITAILDNKQDTLTAFPLKMK